MRLTVDGHDVYAYTGTRALVAAQPTVVFVHGAANDHSVWALQSRYFAHHGHNVLAFDLPGHGRSGGAALPAVDAIADWLPRTLDAAGVAAAALVGHSLGSLAALACAARHPQRVTKIALLGPAVPMPVSDALLAAAQADDRCPALVVMGARDLMAPPKGAQALVSALADKRVTTLPGTGHALMAEQPDAVLDALRAFLQLRAPEAARTDAPPRAGGRS